MRQRNFTLLIIILVLILAFLFGWFYFFPPKNNTEGESSSFVNFLADFIPFVGNDKENNINPDTNNEDISGFVDELVPDLSLIKLVKISTFPVSGYGVFMKERYESIPEEDASSAENPTPPSADLHPYIRYVERATGNIYQTFADQIEERQFSSAVIPIVYEALFGNNGESVILRYLKNNTNNIESFLGKLPKEQLGGDSGEILGLNGSFLPENISSMSVSPDQSTLFYLLSTDTISLGTTVNLQTNLKTQIFDSSLSEWTSDWPISNKITLTTKPSYNSLGYMYTVNPSSKSLNKILSGISGLTTLMSPDGEKVIYADNTLSLYLYEIDSGKTSSIGIKTLPEKCVWSKINPVLYCAVPSFLSGSQYPDTWYQGIESFSDDIWMVNTNTGNTTKIASPMSLVSLDIDAFRLAVDKNEEFLFFMNKKDSYLWGLKLK